MNTDPNKGFDKNIVDFSKRLFRQVGRERMGNKSVVTIVLFLAIFIGSCSGTDFNGPAAGGGGTPGAPGTSTPTTVSVTLSAAAIANGGTSTVTAVVRDASSAVVPNVNVTFSVISAGTGTFTPASAVTNASGVATSVFTAITPNTTATIRASVTVGLGTISNSASITIGAPPQVPTSVVVALSSATTPSTGGSVTVNATVTDAAGGIPGATVTFSVSNAAAGSLSALTAPTNASGVATVTFTANAGNMYVDIRATVGTLNNSATLQIGSPPPPVPVSMSLTINPLSISILSQAAVSVTLLDGTSSPAFNNAVTLTITTGTTLASFSPVGTALTASLTTNASGVASATVYSGSSSGTVQITATSGTLTPVSASFFITSAPASISLNIVNSSLISGQTTNITATVRNIVNNPVTDGTVVNFAITSLQPYAGALSAASASTVNGIASVTFTADVSITGPVIIQASVGTVPPVQTIIIVNPAQAGSIEFVSAMPAVINIKGAGTSDSTVKFKVLSSAGAALANQSVNFQLYGPVGATLDSGGGVTSSGSTNATGEVSTILHAGSVAGPVRIVATTSVTGPPAATLTASSGNISIGGGLPSDRFFSVAVSKFNLDGIGCLGLTSTISAYLADRFGNYNILQGTSVSFTTDSGAMDTSNVTDASGYTTSVFRTQSPIPTDVAFEPWEPNYTVGARTYNPRDGWLSILVSTTGEEHFVDENANGVYNLGETFTDIPEPFIDSDDSGSRIAGELFFDWPSYVTPSGTNPLNPNGVYDVVNTVWDARIPIFRQINLVMTGPPSFGANTTRIVDSANATLDIAIPRTGQAFLYVYVSDINMNALIGGTKVTMTSDKTEATITLVGGAETLADGMFYGPAVLVYRVTNNNTSAPAVPVSATLSAEIDWPGNCGRAAKPKVFYPGTITLP